MNDVSAHKKVKRLIRKDKSVSQELKGQSMQTMVNFVPKKMHGNPPSNFHAIFFQKHNIILTLKEIFIIIFYENTSISA